MSHQLLYRKDIGFVSGHERSVQMTDVMEPDPSSNTSLSQGCGKTPP